MSFRALSVLAVLLSPALLPASAQQLLPSSVLPARPPRAGELIARVPEKPQPSSKLYRWSVVALLAANAADAGTSWGRQELNPVLAQRGGTFGWQSAVVKSGLTGGLLLFQHFTRRQHPELERSMAYTNFAAAGALAGVAAHNQATAGR